jgi:hypothetical protein
MITPGLAFASTSRQTIFRTLARVLLYGDIVHASSGSLVHVLWHERVTTVGNFYTEDAMQNLSDNSDLINFKQLMTTWGARLNHSLR